jgi:predicted TIM-barrel fold metal-dependent hydrolase
MLASLKDQASFRMWTTLWPLLASLPLLAGGCANSQYSGTIIDLHIHVAFEAEAATSMHRSRRILPQDLDAATSDPRLIRGMIVMATGGPEKTRTQNDRLIAWVADDPSKFAIGSVDPADGEAALAELDRLAKLGVRWLKLHPNTQKFDVASPAVLAVVRRAGELGMPVTFDASVVLDADQIGKFVVLATQAPNTQIVLAHMGMARFDELVTLSVLEVYPWWQRNLWLELSAIAPTFADSPRRDELVWTLRKVGIDRVLFGSDYPAFTPAESIRAVQSLGLTESELRHVFFTNAAALLGMTPAPAR